MPDKIAWDISKNLMEGLITEDEALSYCLVSLNEVLIEIKKDNSFDIIWNRIQDVSVTLALMSKQFEKKWDC